MHLKVCPNPQCGKVSDVSTAVCESCGETFPRITLVSPGTASAEAPAGSPQQGTAPTAAEEGKPRVPAWPLVMMAIVAGGLPLLWANRAQLPTPKTWQVNPADAAKTGGTSPGSVALTPPPAVSAQTPPPAPAANTAPPPLPPAPVQAAAPSEADPGSPGPSADTADDTKNQARRQATGETAKKAAKAPPAKKTEPPRPCTEAVAALGLCDPKQAEK